MSASSIGAYEKCPKQYHYRYIEKPDVPRLEWDFQEFGKCAHKVLELFHIDLMNNVRKPEEYSAVMSNCFKLTRLEYKDKVSRGDYLELKGIFQTYLDNIAASGLPHVIGTELEFNFTIADHPIRGFIDRVDKIGDGEYKVVDYKTTKSPKYLTEFQLVLYALALQKIYPDAKIIHGSYMLLRQNCNDVGWTFNEQHYQAAVKKVVDTGKAIDTDKIWEKKPSALCRFCDFQSICQDVWSEENGLGE